MKTKRRFLAVMLSLVFTFAMFTQVVSASAIDTVTVTFNINGGNGANTTRTRTPGEALGTLPNGPTRTGHTFIGWYPAISGTLDAGTNLQITANTPTPDRNVTYYARWAKQESKVLTHTGSMLIQGLKGLTTNSNAITFNGSAIPATATVDSISIHTGKSTVSGAILGNNLQISSTARTGTLSIPWNGADNSTLTNTTYFWNMPARATYTVLWNGTVISNTPGNLLNPTGTAAIRGYSDVKLTINYTYPLQ